MNEAIKNIHRSIFTKILVFFSIVYIIIMSSEYASHKFLFRRQHFPQIQRITVHYCDYLTKTIGSPPNITVADSLCQYARIGIFITGDDFQWSSDEKLIHFDKSQLNSYLGSPEIKIGSVDVMYVNIYRNGYNYLFQLNKREEGLLPVAEQHSILSIIFTTIIILAMYFLVHWQLKPIIDLKEGVKQLGKGNFTYETPITTKDELGQLIQSFNEMSRHIVRMLKARDQLMLDVSHELRSPLTRVKVALEFMEEGKTKQALTEDIAEMEKMITTILETERLNSPYGGLELNDVNIAFIISETAKEFKERRPGIRLLEIPDVAIIKGDEERLHILMRNIISNSLKYTKKEGYAVEISLREKTGELVVVIQDYGQGIPESELPYVFEPFYRVDKSRSKKTGGYGLGMSLSKKIMVTHGGKMEIVSKVGIGTTVFLRFRK